MRIVPSTNGYTVPGSIDARLVADTSRKRMEEVLMLYELRVYYATPWGRLSDLLKKFETAFPSRCACSNGIGSTAPKPELKDLPL